MNSSDINLDLKSDLQALQDDLAKKFQLPSNESSSLAQESVSPQRKISIGYQEERLLAQPKYMLSKADRKNILQQSTSLKILYEDVAKALPNQNPGIDIIHYLITKNKSSNKSQAIAILTAMIEAGYIIEVDMIGINSAAATVGKQQQTKFYFDENDEINHISIPSSDTDYLHEFNENAFYKLLRPNEIMSNSGTFNLNLDVDNSSVHLSKPETSSSKSINICNLMFIVIQWKFIFGIVVVLVFFFFVQLFVGVDGFIQNPHGLSSAQVRESDIEDTVISTTGSKSLQEAFCKHEDMLLSKLHILNCSPKLALSASQIVLSEKRKKKKRCINALMMTLFCSPIASK